MNALQGLAMLLVLQSAGELLSRGLHLPVPGPVLGMVALAGLLAWAPLRQRIQAAAEVLLAHLSLLFVPVGVGVLSHLDLLQQMGLKLLLVVALSTWVGLAVTAWTTQRLLREPDPPA
jgi:holin-like protein